MAINQNVHPALTMSGLTSSLADMLAAAFPDAAIYANPNQQGTEVPCWFINYVPSNKLVRDVGRHFFREIMVDLVYELEYNRVDLFDRYLEAAEIVDDALVRLPYKFGDGSELPLQIKEREWKVSNDALHYQFKIKARVIKERVDPVKMQEIESLTETMKEGEQDGNQEES